VTVLLIALVLVILLGLPVAALSSARRLPQPRSRSIRGDASWELARRFNLVGRDFTEVQVAVQEGRAAVPERLRPAAYALAEYAIGRHGGQGLGAGPRLSRRAQRLSAAFYLAAALVVLGVVLAQHGWRIRILTGIYVVGGNVIVLLRTRRRRATARAALAANRSLAEAQPRLRAYPDPTVQPSGRAAEKTGEGDPAPDP